MEHHMGALDPGEDGLAQLKALLGSDDWGSPGMSSAQAALAQASSAIVPALRTGSVCTLEAKRWVLLKGFALNCGLGLSGWAHHMQAHIY